MSNESTDKGGIKMSIRRRVLFTGIVIAAVLVFGFYSAAQAGMEMKKMATSGIFEGVGTIKGIVPSTSEIILQHEAIKGLMKAMTMGYAVKSVDLLKGVQPGDNIKFKIDAATKVIIAIEPLKK